MLGYHGAALPMIHYFVVGWNASATLIHEIMSIVIPIVLIIDLFKRA